MDNREGRVEDGEAGFLEVLAMTGEGLGLHGKGAAGGGQIKPSLPSHPKFGVTPSNAFQGQCYGRRDSTTPIQQSGSGVAAHV